MLHPGSKLSLVCSGVEENHQELKRKHGSGSWLPHGVFSRASARWSLQYICITVVIGRANVQLERKALMRLWFLLFQRRLLSMVTSAFVGSQLLSMSVPTSCTEHHRPELVSSPFSIPCLWPHCVLSLASESFLCVFLWQISTIFRSLPLFQQAEPGMISVLLENCAQISLIQYYTL